MALPDDQVLDHKVSSGCTRRHLRSLLVSSTFLRSLDCLNRCYFRTNEREVDPTKVVCALQVIASRQGIDSELHCVNALVFRFGLSWVF